MEFLNFLYEYFWVPAAVVGGGYILLRWMGTRAVAEMTAIDLMILMVLTTAVTEPIVTKRLGIALYYSLAVTLSYLLISRSQLGNTLKKWLIPKPRVLIQHGDINEEGLKKSRISLETLLADLRSKGYTKTADIELAVLEEIGKISVIPKADYRPLQPSDLQITPAPAFIPIPLIMDGKIIYQNLIYLKKDQEWLILQLKSYGIRMEDVKDITLATYTQQGTIDIDRVDAYQPEGPYDYYPGKDREK